MAKEAEQENPGRDLGRNDRCHCGSGKKYKQCCLVADEAAIQEARAKQAAAEPPAEKPADGEESSPQQHKTQQHARTQQPWKRDYQNTGGTPKRTIPRKVGS